MDIASLLETALMASDAATRNSAEQQLSQLAEQHYEEYMKQFCEVLLSGASVQVRILAALGMKNQLTSKLANKRIEQLNRWISASPATKATVKDAAIKVLLSDSCDVFWQDIEAVATVVMYSCTLFTFLRQYYTTVAFI